MAKPKITLYYDVVSPFGYMAYYMLRNSPVFSPCELTYIPIFLGGVMKATGNIVPLTVKNKDVWINEERRRWATLFDIPMPHGEPDGFPVLTLAIQRALVAIRTLSPDHLTAATDALYRKYWGERNVEGVHKPDVLGKVLASVLGEELARKVMERSTSAEGKKELNERSEEALREGAFGVPWFVVTNAEGKKEAFWGFDHIGQVTHFLGLEKPRARDGWQAVL